MGQGLAVEARGSGQLLDLVKFLAPQGAAQHGPLHVFPQVRARAELQPAAIVRNSLASSVSCSRDPISRASPTGVSSRARS